MAGAAATGTAATTAACADLEIVFARGSGEVPGLGITGTPLVSDVKSALPSASVSSYAVDYAASYDQTSAAIGIRTYLGTGQTIPAELAPRVVAVIAFGNPLGLYGQTIKTAT
ncbi:MULTISPECIES: cutinase family protein [Amycolatopsis]|uniref:cutinase family protein n=1 Tax=Amycolatopsis TaxID=1813 RepID=UPI00350FCBE5